MSSSSKEFDVEAFEQRLANLKDTQEGIQQMSSWCLQQRAHHKKIVCSWLHVLKKVRVEHRLTLFYLANDVIQYSKRKNYEFVESWGTALQKATTMVRDEKVRKKIVRIFKIWEQREIYSEEYLSDLNGLLNMNPLKKNQSISDLADEFQNSALISNIRECVRLESNTDKNFKNLPKAPECDIESVKAALKDRSHTEDVEKDIDDYLQAGEIYMKSLKAEIVVRKTLLTNIEAADTFYTNQKGELKVVLTAYKSFGHRIKAMKKKLDEITPNLPSPIPSPDINAPSPEQDADIVLPDEPSNLNMKNSNSYTSFMDGNLPFDINDFKRRSPDNGIANATQADTQPIQVISNRSEDKRSSFEVNDFFKSITNERQYGNQDMPQPVPPVTNYSSTNDLFSQGHSGNTYVSRRDMYPSMSSNYSNDSEFLGTQETNSYERTMPLMPPPPIPPSLGAAGDDFNSTWDMNLSWTSNDSGSSFNHMLDTPVSPPHFEREGISTNVVEYIERRNDDLLNVSQDVDHRQMHMSPSTVMLLGKDKGRPTDIDHRNLISLTGSPGLKTELDSKMRNSPPWTADEKEFRATFSTNSNDDLNIQENSSGVNSQHSTALLPPPLPPNLNDFLVTPNSTFDKTMPPPSYIKLDSYTKGKLSGIKTNANDNNESIDMEMSDDDTEEYTRENQPCATTECDLPGYDGLSNEEFSQSPDSNYRQPLLESPDFLHSEMPNVWDTKAQNRPNLGIGDNGMSERLPNVWKSQRMPPPQFRMVNSHSFSRSNTAPSSTYMMPPRNFSPIMKSNFRSPGIRSPRSLYFNSRGQGRGGMHNRGNFRGKTWQ